MKKNKYEKPLVTILEIDLKHSIAVSGELEGAALWESDW